MELQKILDNAPIIKTWAGDVDQKIRDKGEQLLSDWLQVNITDVMTEAYEDQ